MDTFSHIRRQHNFCVEVSKLLSVTNIILSIFTNFPFEWFILTIFTWTCHPRQYLPPPGPHKALDLYLTPLDCRLWSLNYSLTGLCDGYLLIDCWWIHQSEQGKIFSSISIFHTISIRMPASRAVRRIHCVTGSPSSLTRRSAISCRTVTLSTLTVKVTFCSSTKIIISFSRLSVWPGGVSPGLSTSWQSLRWLRFHRWSIFRDYQHQQRQPPRPDRSRLPFPNWGSGSKAGVVRACGGNIPNRQSLKDTRTDKCFSFDGFEWTPMAPLGKFSINRHNNTSLLRPTVF